MSRFAIYYAPFSRDPLWQFGTDILGYDAATGLDAPVTPLAGLNAMGWAALTDEPRRYGFHATLKAPFELAAGRTSSSLVAAVEAFAAAHRPVVLDGLAVSNIGRFVALVPVGPTAALESFAYEVVKAFEPFRAPLGAADRARRAKDGQLSARQTELLDRYGYPYVAEQFRFHMTLTGSLDPTLQPAIQAALARRYAETVPAGLRAIDRLAIFEQPSRDSRFHIIAAVPLG
ncbi:MAG: DUF1045 domain-containing protein [Hyphomicrobiaceae bacterium]|jgi:putative phosphonate metabolism protein